MTCSSLSYFLDSTRPPTGQRFITQTHLINVGSSSFALEHQLIGEKTKHTIALSTATLVLMDFELKKSVLIPGEVLLPFTLIIHLFRSGTPLKRLLNLHLSHLFLAYHWQSLAFLYDPKVFLLWKPSSTFIW
eukprot:TRINITY_DN4772_c0_g1_i23.p1 TRINITY_DN4772_c0_g1~~TRINITY_DN4772_c0_g1_i23.p1  ORF type:complete len:132 (+),score=2.54 TRINITY_DN4772_c0_g1_i23:364-759(+)